MANILETKKYHYLYRTTNLLNERYYIGMHSTNFLEDGYVGSGKRLWFELRKYGKQNFKIEILEFCTSREYLAVRERQLVTQIEVNDINCLNLKPGGTGGAHLAATEGFKNKLKDPEFKKAYSEKCRERNLKQYKEGTRKSYLPNWTGKNHTSETIQKMKEIKKGQGKGETNSQFGTVWITDGENNRKIKSTDKIPDLWYIGRKGLKK